MSIPALRCENCTSVWFVRAERPAADSPEPQHYDLAAHMLICTHCRSKYLWNFRHQRWDRITRHLPKETMYQLYARKRELV